LKSKQSALWDTALHEPFLKATLRQFQLLYLGSMGLLFLVLAFFVYTIEKEQLIAKEMRSMNTYLSLLENQLKEHQLHYSKEIRIDTKEYAIALYDIDRIPIATQLKEKPDWTNTVWINEGILYSRHTLSAYFLGVANVIIAKKIDSVTIIQHLAALLIPLFFIMVIVGWILSRIAFKPAQKAFDTIDTFIQHATHDLNTPIAAILSNSRILEEKMTDPTLLRLTQRIIIGAKTLNALYDDLVYLNFQTKTHVVKPEPIDQLIQEQLSLFDTLCEYKKLTVTTRLSAVMLRVSSDEFQRLINNLLSNAVKYNKSNGWITLTLTDEYLSIKDGGIGLSEEEKSKIFERYWRVGSFETGLGIGMEIVVRVCKVYGLTLTIDSEKNQGSEIIVRWPKSLLV
jgi:two-component system OmpR family sensor kinase